MLCPLGWPCRSADSVPVGQFSVDRIESGPCLTGRIGSEVRVSASFQKNARLVCLLGSGARLVSDKADVVPVNRVD